MQKTNRLAVASAFLWPFGIIGLAVAIIALIQINKTGEGGRQWAITGIVLCLASYLAMYLWAANFFNGWTWFL